MKTIMKAIVFTLRVIAAVAAGLVGLAAIFWIVRGLVHRPAVTTVVVLRDVTDTFGAQPDVGEILELFDRSAAGRWNGARLLASTVTDVTYNRVAEVKMKPDNKWLSNELQRNKEVKQFQSDVVDVVALVSSEAAGRSHSSVYRAIAVQLTRLADHESTTKIFVVYSDLMENSPDLSMYDDSTFRALQTDPGSVAALFEQQQPLPSLDGIDVRLIHQPTDAARDRQYRIVSGFYRNLLESKGARVQIGANVFKP
ncbi:MAG TPA: hypothetical protein VEY71_12145 [Chitinophagales bacterium]|nr:hypothetical protein [Chitinophagales bacterium]